MTDNVAVNGPTVRGATVNQTSEVWSSIDSLVAEIASLSELTKALEDRLAPVLKDAPEAEPREADKRIQTAPLAIDIYCKAGLVRETRLRIQALNDRLAL